MLHQNEITRDLSQIVAAHDFLLAVKRRAEVTGVARYIPAFLFGAVCFILLVYLSLIEVSESILLYVLFASFLFVPIAHFCWLKILAYLVRVYGKVLANAIKHFEGKWPDKITNLGSDQNLLDRKMVVKVLIKMIADGGRYYGSGLTRALCAAFDAGIINSSTVIDVQRLGLRKVNVRRRGYSTPLGKLACLLLFIPWLIVMTVYLVLLTPVLIVMSVYLIIQNLVQIILSFFRVHTWIVILKRFLLISALS